VHALSGDLSSWSAGGNSGLSAVALALQVRLFMILPVRLARVGCGLLTLLVQQESGQRVCTRLAATYPRGRLVAIWA
jgi:hypothetical protein